MRFAIRDDDTADACTVSDYSPPSSLFYSSVFLRLRFGIGGKLSGPFNDSYAMILIHVCLLLISDNYDDNIPIDQDMISKYLRMIQALSHVVLPSRVNQEGRNCHLEKNPLLHSDILDQKCSKVSITQINRLIRALQKRHGRVTCYAMILIHNAFSILIVFLPAIHGNC